MKKFIFLMATVFAFQMQLFAQITSGQVIATANDYLNHVWTASSANIVTQSTYCPGGGGTIRTPNWVQVGQNTALPYNWSGFSSIAGFDQGLINGKCAGDTDTYDSDDEPCAVGVDCSGFTSRCYNLEQQYATSMIDSYNNLFGQYNSMNDLEPGDMINKPGSHVRLVVQINPNGTINTIESAGGNNDKVMAANYSYSQIGAYKPMYYRYMEHSNYIPDPIGDCANAYALNCGEPVLAQNVSQFSNVSHYGCVDRIEIGPESLFSFTPSVNGDFVVQLSDFDSNTHDLDIFIMGSCNLTDCLSYSFTNEAVMPNAQAGRKYYIMVDTYNVVDTQYTIKVSCPSVEVPDVVIDELWISPEEPEAESPVDLFVKIRNVGDAPANDFNIKYKIGDNEIGSVSHASLAPNQSAVKKLENYEFSTDGTFNYCATIEGVANELNTNNNNSCRNIHIIPAKHPDLKVETVWMNPELPWEQHPVDLYAKITNIGDEAAPDVLLKLKMGDTQVGVVTHGSLDVGETITKKLEGYAFPTFGIYNYCVTASTSGDEEVFNNNTKCKEVEALELEDVTVTLPHLSQNFIMAGDDLEVRARQSYAGPYEEEELPIITLSYYLSKNCQVSSDDLLLGHSYSSIGTSNRNSLEVKSLHIPNTIIPGTYKIIFVGDSEDVIEEDNEENNFQCLSINIDNAFINGNDLQSRVYIYPNPTSGVISLMSNTDVNIKRVTAYDTSGRLIRDVEGDQISEFDITNAETGTYIIQIYNQNNETAMYRVIKR